SHPADDAHPAGRRSGQGQSDRQGALPGHRRRHGALRFARGLRVPGQPARRPEDVPGRRTGALDRASPPGRGRRHHGCRGARPLRDLSAAAGAALAGMDRCPEAEVPPRPRQPRGRGRHLRRHGRHRHHHHRLRARLPRLPLRRRGLAPGAAATRRLVRALRRAPRHGPAGAGRDLAIPRGSAGRLPSFRSSHRVAPRPGEAPFAAAPATTETSGGGLTMRSWNLASLGRAMTLATALGALFAAAPAQAQIELKLNGLHAPEHPVSLTHHFFADRVAQLTGGEITVDVFDARQLGDAVESVQSLRNGTIAFVTVSTSNLSQVDPKIDMFSLPYLFKSADHYWDYLTSER